MEQGITPEMRKTFKAMLSQAEPYSPEEFEEAISWLDGPWDPERYARIEATMAKQLLEQYPE